MIVLTTALSYTKKQVIPFYESLMDTGYVGRIAILTNNCEAKDFFREERCEILLDKDNGYPLNSRRFFVYKEFLRDVSEPVVIVDCRDVIFQDDPELRMPTNGVNGFLEHQEMTLRKCPYNSKWMKAALGDKAWKDFGDRSIICAGVMSGMLTEYVTWLWECLSQLPPLIGLDQAVHNICMNRLQVKNACSIHSNEVGPVYTVGYINRETIQIAEDRFIHNEGGVPCIVHQYDRHRNLMEAYQNGRWPIRGE